jgi:secreted trypsin-like serine protease
LFSDTIRPICLPSGEIEEDVVFSASGWGENIAKGVYSDTKKNLDLRYWTEEKCKKAYKYLELPGHIVCAGGEQGVDTCRGDSGGPLVWRKDNQELWGVTSTGNIVCGTKGTPGIYTSVIDYLGWIQYTIASK